MDFLAIDFETANLNQSPCSLGLTLVSNQKVVDCKSYLINPKEPFSNSCIKVNGITPETVKNSPEFPAVWEEVQPLFLKYPVVAHNISFDFDVLRKALNKYHLEVPNLELYCTLQLARRNFPEIPKFNLPALCEHFGISLDNHHSCDDDSLACAKLLIRMMTYSDFKLSGFLPAAHVPSNNAFFDTPEYKESTVEYDDLLSLSFDQKSFVITGDIEGYSREELSQIIIERGGNCKTAVSKKVDFLIVGMQNQKVIKNKFEIKSEKIIKAERLRNEGFPIKIISDEDFLQVLHQQDTATSSEANFKDWFSFYDNSDRLRKLKAVGILTPTATEIKQLFYCGLYSRWKLEKCELIGYADSSVLVISLFGEPHKIHADYLKEMQPTKKEAEKINA